MLERLADSCRNWLDNYQGLLKKSADRLEEFRIEAGSEDLENLSANHLRSGKTKK